MRVLHVITGLGQGGAQSMLRSLLSASPSEDAEAAVISLASGGQVAREIRAMGIEVLELDMPASRLSIGPLPRLADWIRAQRPEVIQTWLYHADLLGGLLGRLCTRAPIVWGLHHTLEQTNTLKPLTRTIVRLNAWLSRYVPARIVCCSRLTLETHALRGYRRDRMVLIRNGVDTEHFHPDPAARLGVRKELGLEPDTRLVGMFARFHPQKDHRTFLTAAALLHTRLPEVHFILAGKDIHGSNPQLIKMMQAAGVAAHVHLLGTRSDMARLQAAIDVGTLSSADGEAMPLAIGEAMACEVPCVATNVGDTGELLGETGVCVAPRDPSALAEGWRNLLELPISDRIWMGTSARLQIQNRYSLQASAQAYHQLYVEVAARERS